MKKIFPALLLGLASRSALAIAPPTVPTAIDAMGLHLTLDYEARQLVQAKVNSLCRHQASLEARIALAESAFPLIDQVLAEEGVPADFRYLVLQESALQGNAESKHGAVGYWQFKRETALDYGLTVDRQVDERRHLTASTRAAARYLVRSNASLHNWVNTLLSYNLGLGGVQPYTNSGDTNARRMAVTASSSVYILDFLAQKIVFEPACAQHTVPFTPWREVPATPGLSLAQQAAAFSADPATVARLNQWLLAAKVPTNGRAYTLLVPLNGTATPAPLLATSPVPRRGQRPAAAPVATAAVATSYLNINGLRALVAQPGDTPASLAARGGASEGFFMKVNELSRNELLIPGSPYFFERKRDAAEQEYHIVRPGQSLTAIAQHFGVLRHALLAYNHLHVGESVQPGLVLWLAHVRPRNVAAEYRALPGSRPAPAVAVQRPAPAPEPASEEVEEEIEEAEEIAAIKELPTEVPGAPVLTLPSAPVRPMAMPTSPAPAVVWTPVPRSVARPTRPTAVPAVVPVAASAPAPVRPATAGTYTVAPHETLYGVARRLGVRPAELAAWNGLSPTVALQVGQVLRVGTSAVQPVAAAATSAAETYYAHTVAVGDTFFNISRRYGCSVAELQASNSRAESGLRIGEVLRVPIH